MRSRLHKGDAVTRRGEEEVGTVTRVKERGVAGSAHTYIEYIDVTYEDGRVVQGDPSLFRRVDEGW